MAQKNPWEWYQPPSLLDEDTPTYNKMETPESIQALYGGYQPPTTPTGLPSTAAPVQTTPAWTEIPPPGMNYNLARGLGAAAAAIAPRSIGGRMGAAAAGLASQDEANRLQRIRIGSTIQESQERTGLARMMRETQQRQLALKVQRGQEAAKVFDASNMAEAIDKQSGIPGFGKIMRSYLESGDLPFHEAAAFAKGKKNTPVHPFILKQLGIEWSDTENPMTKEDLEVYFKGLALQKEKQYATREVTAWNPELKQWGFMDRNTNDWVKDKNGTPLKAPPPSSTVQGFTYIQDKSGEYQQAPTKIGGSVKPTGVKAPPKDTQSRQMEMAKNIFIEREGREPTEQEVKDEWNKQFPQKQSAADRLKLLLGEGQGKKTEQEYDLINGKLVPRKK